MFRAEEFINNTLQKIDFENLQKHPNILIAARFWDDDRFSAALTFYRFMRTIDDMVDDRKAASQTLSCMEKEVLSDKVNSWIDCLKGFAGEDRFLKDVVDTIYRFKIPLSFFHNFARSMLYDIDHNGFDTFDDFINYSEGASNGPASIFVHLCCLTRINGSYLEPDYDIEELARPCALFSYIVHIIRDFQKDQRDNLNYFARDILNKNGLDYNDLKVISKSGSVPGSFRNVIRFYLSKADEYRCETIDVLKKLKTIIEPRYYLSLRIIFELYLQVFERINPEKGSFTTGELNPTPDEVRQRLEGFVLENEPASI
jgi:phytoene/squalene synthetase